MTHPGRFTVRRWLTQAATISLALIAFLARLPEEASADGCSGVNTYSGPAMSLRDQGYRLALVQQYDKALVLLKRAVEISRAAPCENHDVAFFEEGLGDVLAMAHRYDEAVEAYRRALGRKVTDWDVEAAETAWLGLAESLRRTGRLNDAAAIFEKLLGRHRSDATIQAKVEGGMARVYAARGDWNAASATWAKAEETSISYFEKYASVYGQSIDPDAAYSALVDARPTFVHRIDALWRSVPAGSNPAPPDSSKSFVSAQWASITSSSLAVALANARMTAATPRLEALTHRRQALQLQLSRSLAYADDELRNREVDRQLREVDRLLAAEFPRYTERARERPVDVSAVRSVLRPNEALVLFALFSEETEDADAAYVWVVTSDNFAWAKLSRSADELKRDVDTLRCGTDRSAWHNGNRCADLTGVAARPAAAPAPLPFRHDVAKSLYRTLFGSVAGLLRGKQLVIAPGDILATLPFPALLVDDSGGKEGFAAEKSKRWLVREHAISVVPTVGNFVTLRQAMRPSRAESRYIGFGNPLLDGASRVSAAAKDARSLRTCADVFQAAGTSPTQTASNAIEPLAERGGLADREKLLRQPPLPETAYELCSVARVLDESKSDVHLGAAATEEMIKKLSESGKLKNYQVLHFATHAAIAGALGQRAAPGLILTPPAVSNQRDDGYLSSREIEALEIDAELVILSACNTASPDKSGSEAFTGLAYSFFIAGTRALLVTNWSVDSLAAVRLIEVAIHELVRNPGLGRAEALRRSMIALIESDVATAVPEVWAPFVLIGDSGLR